MTDSSGHNYGIYFALATNIWSRHMVPLARELAILIGPAKFRMVLFEKVDDERLNMGWEAGGERPEWLVGPPEKDDDLKQLLDLCLGAEVAVIGSVSMDILRQRVSTGKLTLVMSERMLKKKGHYLRMINPRYALGTLKYRNICNHPNAHALAIGYHAPRDLRKIGAFGNRIYKWGYFVDLNDEPPSPMINRPLKILWVGRMLSWKRADLLVKAVAKIQHQSWFGQCTIVGDGPEKGKLLSLASKYKITDKKLAFHPSVKMEAVRTLMREHDVYVLASNRNEGWGAVAGEAMSEGCVLVANDQAGASRSMIIHEETGLLFKNGNVDSLVNALKELGQNPALRQEVQQSAWKHVHEVWSPKVAAMRLLGLIRDLSEKTNTDRYHTGPGSRA